MLGLRKAADQVYNDVLFDKATAAGYNTFRVEHEGVFHTEIRGFTQEQIREFSPGAERIHQWFADRGIDYATATAEQHEAAKVHSREDKLLVPLEELKAGWREMAADLGIDFTKIIPSQEIERVKSVEATQEQVAKALDVVIARMEATRDAVASLGQAIADARQAGDLDKAEGLRALVKESRLGLDGQSANQLTKAVREEAPLATKEQVADAIGKAVESGKLQVVDGGKLSIQTKDEIAQAKAELAQGIKEDKQLRTEQALDQVLSAMETARSGYTRAQADFAEAMGTGDNMAKFQARDVMRALEPVMNKTETQVIKDVQAVFPDAPKDDVKAAMAKAQEEGKLHARSEERVGKDGDHYTRTTFSTESKEQEADRKVLADAAKEEAKTDRAQTLADVAMERVVMRMEQAKESLEHLREDLAYARAKHDVKKVDALEEKYRETAKLVEGMTEGQLKHAVQDAATEILNERVQQGDKRDLPKEPASREDRQAQLDKDLDAKVRTLGDDKEAKLAAYADHLVQSGKLAEESNVGFKAHADAIGMPEHMRQAGAEQGADQGREAKAYISDDAFQSAKLMMADEGRLHLNVHKFSVETEQQTDQRRAEDKAARQDFKGAQWDIKQHERKEDRAQGQQQRQADNKAKAQGKREEWLKSLKPEDRQRIENAGKQKAMKAAKTAISLVHSPVKTTTRIAGNMVRKASEAIVRDTGQLAAIGTMALAKGVHAGLTAGVQHAGKALDRGGDALKAGWKAAGAVGEQKAQEQRFKAIQGKRAGLGVTGDKQQAVVKWDDTKQVGQGIREKAAALVDKARAAGVAAKDSWKQTAPARGQKTGAENKQDRDYKALSHKAEVASMSALGYRKNGAGEIERAKLTIKNAGLLLGVKAIEAMPFLDKTAAGKAMRNELLTHIQTTKVGAVESLVGHLAIKGRDLGRAVNQLAEKGIRNGVQEFRARRDEQAKGANREAYKNLAVAEQKEKMGSMKSAVEEARQDMRKAVSKVLDTAKARYEQAEKRYDAGKIDEQALSKEHANLKKVEGLVEKAFDKTEEKRVAIEARQEYEKVKEAHGKGEASDKELNAARGKADKTAEVADKLFGQSQEAKQAVRELLGVDSRELAKLERAGQEQGKLEMKEEAKAEKSVGQEVRNEQSANQDQKADRTEAREEKVVKDDVKADTAKDEMKVDSKDKDDKKQDVVIEMSKGQDGTWRAEEVKDVKATADREANAKAERPDADQDKEKDVRKDARPTLDDILKESKADKGKERKTLDQVAAEGADKEQGENQKAEQKQSRGMAMRMSR